MKHIDAHIMGQTYTLHCSDEGEALLRTAVHTVDKAMCQIRDAGKIRARDKIAVLAALNIAAAQAQAAPPSPPPLTVSEDAVNQAIARIDQALRGDNQLL